LHWGGRIEERLERVMRIELTYRAWEASVLPLNYTRMVYCVDLQRFFTLSA
jgi:hypothetical protein